MVPVIWPMFEGLLIGLGKVLMPSTNLMSCIYGAHCMKIAYKNFVKIEVFLHISMSKQYVPMTPPVHPDYMGKQKI